MVYSLLRTIRLLSIQESMWCFKEEFGIHFQDHVACRVLGIVTCSRPINSQHVF